jgi:hypothetical protein
MPSGAETPIALDSGLFESGGYGQSLPGNVFNPVRTEIQRGPTQYRLSVTAGSCATRPG